MENIAFKFPHTPSLLQGLKKKNERIKGKGKKVSLSKQGCGKGPNSLP